AVPIPTPVTRPATTVAFAGSDVVHVTVRSTSVLPFASFGVAENDNVPPGTSSSEAGGVITTVETGAGGDVPSPHPQTNARTPTATLINSREAALRDSLCAVRTGFTAASL